MKFSKLALFPLVALVLAGCTPTQPTVDPTTTAPTTTETEQPSTSTTTPEPVPTWADAEKALMEATLGGHVLPFVNYEGQTVTVEEGTEAAGDAGVKYIVYQVTPVPEGAEAAIKAALVADGYVFEEPEAPEVAPAAEGEEAPAAPLKAVKVLEKKHLHEALHLTLESGVGLDESTFLTVRVNYNCDKVVKTWPEAEIAELCASLYCDGVIPAPDFEYEHISLEEVGDYTATYVMYFGDFTEKYNKVLHANGYELTVDYDEDGTKMHVAENQVNTTGVIMYHEPEINGTVITIYACARNTWLDNIEADVNTLLGVEGLPVPEPMFDFLECVLIPTPATEEEGASYIYSLGIADASYFKVYADQFAATEGYAVLDTDDESYAVIIHEATLTVVVLSYMDFGGLGMLMVGYEAATEMDAAETEIMETLALYAKMFFGAEVELPTITGMVASGGLVPSATPVSEEENGLKATIYGKNVAAQKTEYTTGLTTLGYVKAPNEDVEYYTNLETGITVVVECVPERNFLQVTVFMGLATSWFDVLPTSVHGYLASLLGGNLNLLPFGLVTDLMAVEADGYIGEGITVVYGSAASTDPITAEELTAYHEALIALKWNYVVATKENKGGPETGGNYYYMDINGRRVIIELADLTKGAGALYGLVITEHEIPKAPAEGGATAPTTVE